MIASHTQATEPLEAPDEHSTRTVSQCGQSFQLRLSNILKESFLQCPYESSQAFLPNDSLDSIMTPENIEEYISTSEHTALRDRCSEIAKYVCGNPESKAAGVFAVLLLIEHPQLILDFMEEMISDLDLPLCLRDKGKSHFSRYCLDRKVEQSLIPIKRFDKWESVQRFAFYKHQWWVKLPVFETSTSKSLDAHPAIQLHNSSILPWIEYKPIYQQNSDVVRVRIHDAHHTFRPEVSNHFVIG